MVIIIASKVKHNQHIVKYVFKHINPMPKRNYFDFNFDFSSSDQGFSPLLLSRVTPRNLGVRLLFRNIVVLNGRLNILPLSCHDRR